MRYYLFFFAFTLACAAHAQGSNRSPSPSDADVVNRALAEGKSTSTAQATGSPYYFPRWTQGTVLLTAGSVPSPWLKYDLSNDRLLWRRAANDSLQLDTSPITEFTLGGAPGQPAATFRRYLTARIAEPDLRTVFFEVLYDSGHSALLRRSRRIMVGSNSSVSLAGRSGGHWINSDSYYIKRADNVIEPVRLNQKSVLRTLGQTPALAAFAEHEHLNFSQPANIIRLLKHYDTL